MQSILIDNSDMQKTPIFYGHGPGEMLYALLSRNQRIDVWIERPDGARYGDWSVYHPDLQLELNEFCANTWGDSGGQMKTAMMSTGWFEATGRTYRYPLSHVFNDGTGEIWRITAAGSDWLESLRTVEETH